ncbi:InlB B-repeat-containing protein [Alkalibacter rhizosphaerae]|uniref:InlB B-repeat-containing protein n=1 Tax=Alkalibacter rhizosphaerae TaxID=2815577 RepID=A0A975AHI2_9FIRM|nr:InlB B-repeat-containing protein [Alkalibacter rhizosphaerae]QSX07644.1 InlB B-repeat-containing protein [Alkalibacter rhizosphaerae]
MMKIRRIMILLVLLMVHALMGSFFLPGYRVLAQESLVEGLQTYTVTYDANGGTGTLVDPNSPYTPLPLDKVGILENVFEKPGYVFASWNTQADGKGITYLPGDSFILAEDTIFYAIYTPGTPNTGRWDPRIFPVLLGAIGCGLIFKRKTSL